MKSRKNFFLFLVFCLVVLSSCDKDDDRGPAKVMVLHASPNAGVVTVQVNGNSLVPTLAYMASSAYNAVSAGTNNIKTAAVGNSNDLINVNVPLNASTSYSLIISDSVSKIKASVVADNLTPPAAGKAHVRFFQLSPNTGAVNVAIRGSDTTLIANRSFNDQATNGTIANFTPVAAGNKYLEVRTVTPSGVIASLPTLPLQAGKIYTVFLSGFAGGVGTQALRVQMVVHN